MEFSAKLAVGGFTLYVAGVTSSYLFGAYTEESRWAQSRPSSGGGAASVVALLTCPVATLGTMWGMATHTEWVLQKIPALFASYGKAVDDVLPIYAKNFTQAFELGRLFDRLQNATGDDAAAVLSEAAAVVGRAVRPEELLAAGKTLLEQDSEQSTASKVLSMFSLVNFVWFISTCGLTALCLPFIGVFAQPLVRLVVVLWTEGILPVLIALKPLYEPLLYCTALLAMVESARFARGHDEHSMTGTMLGVTSLGLFGASWCYSTYLHSTGGGSMQKWAFVSGLFTTAASGALAVMHQSSLIGYISVLSFCGSLGFTAYGTPLCLCIGFSNGMECARTAGACLFLTLARAALRACGVSNMYLRPFESAVDVFGTSVYFLGLVILSAWDGKGKLLMWTNLAAYLTLGTMLGMRGLVNTAKVWASIELFVAYCMYAPRQSSDQQIVFMFSTCAILYGASFYLNTHPELLVALYSSGSNQ